MTALPLLIALAQGDPRALFEQAMAAQKLGQLEAAEKHLEAAAKLAPGNAAIFGNLGAVGGPGGDPPPARTPYQAALKLNPRAAALRLNLGLAYFREARYEPALRELELYLRVDAASEQGRELRAVCLYQLGRWADAAAAYEDLLRSGDKLAWLYGLGQARIRANDSAAAEVAFRKLFAAYPDAPETALLEAQSLISRERYDEALAKLDAIQAPVRGVHFWKGVALENAKRRDEAKAAYAREGDDPLARYALGILEARDGDNDRAARNFELALPADGKEHNVAYHLAGVYLKLGRAAEALPLLDRSIARDPDSTQPRYLRMRALQTLGRAAEAKREAEQIRKLQQRAIGVR